MKFNFVAGVSQGLLDATKSAWRAQLLANSENSSEPHYEAGLAYFQRVLDGEVLTADGGGCVCAVVENHSEFAAALIVVSHAKAKTADACLKMLDVYVQPTLNLADEEPNYAELAWLAAEAIVGCLGLIDDKYPSKELKIHSVFPLDKQFLTAVSTALMRAPTFAKTYEVNFHANWLVVSKKLSP